MIRDTAEAARTSCSRREVVTDRCASCEADAATLTRLSDAVDDLQKVVRLVARRDDREIQAGEMSEVSRSRASPCRARSAVAIPGSDEEVPWDAHLRADVPRYVMEQLKAEAYRAGRTAVSLVLQAMSDLRDEEGMAVFQIRAKDMVADRRKSACPENRKSLQDVLDR